MIQEGLYNLLINDATVSSYVMSSSSPPVFEVYHGTLRKGFTLPAIRISSPSARPIVTTEGTNDLQYRNFQFDCFASDYLTAHRLQIAVRDLLKDFRGTLYDGTVVGSTAIINELDNPLEEGTGGFANRCFLEIRFGYK